MNAHDQNRHRLAAPCNVRRSDRDDRLRLDRQRNAAAAGAAYRLRPERNSSSSPRKTTDRRLLDDRHLRFVHHGDHPGKLPRCADAASHRGTGPRHDRQPLGRHLLGRSDGVRQGHRRVLHRHRGRAVAGPLHRPQALDLAALELRAARRRCWTLRRRQPRRRRPP